MSPYWETYRDVFAGGKPFIRKYLQKYSALETDADFQLRREMSYCPAHAKAAVVEIKNAIFQRMNDITRNGGSLSYHKAVDGEDGGVDLQGHNMNQFLGSIVLPELLVLGKVGIYVDRDQLPEGASVADEAAVTPYLYVYPAEDILAWRYDKKHILSDVLLQETVPQEDLETHLYVARKVQYRLINLHEDGVQVRVIGDDGVIIKDTTLDLKRIPFIIGELSHSLLEDVASYQISMLNIASSDVHFICTANFPFYTEQYDQQTEAATRFAQGVIGTTLSAEERAKLETDAKKSIEVGTVHGRRYPKNMDRPNFIAPPSEPLKISIEKQQQMKDEIRQLVQLALSTIGSKTQSADSKKLDQTGLENGLACVGLELSHIEQEIAKIWAMYEGTDTCAKITYPETYSLNLDTDARCTSLYEELNRTTSVTLQRMLAYRIACLRVGNSATADELRKIEQEINAASVLACDPDTIRTVVELGLLSNETASKSRGYPADETVKAEDDHARRVARIATAQQEATEAARGNPDAASSTKTDAEKAGSQGAEMNDTGSRKTRGGGK